MTIGIYTITNTINQKTYVGLSKNVEKRFIAHRYDLCRSERNRSTNRHLFNAVKKYGIESFKFEVVEIFEDFDVVAIRDAEYKWMCCLNSLNRDFGYNIRSDNSTDGHVVSLETRQIQSLRFKGSNNPNYGNHWTADQKEAMSEKIKSQYRDGGRVCTEQQKLLISRSSTEMWKDVDKKQRMAAKVSKARRQYNFLQYSRDGVFIAEYESMQHVVEMNPDFYPPAIYNVCNGYKKSYRGFLWVKQPKI